MSTKLTVSTEELLKHAAFTLPLHESELDSLLIDENPFDPAGVCTVEGATIAQAEARRDVIIRAVNSFEALREIVETVCDGEDCECEAMGMEKGECLLCAAQKALALADGEQSAPPACVG